MANAQAPTDCNMPQRAWNAPVIPTWLLGAGWMLTAAAALLDLRLAGFCPAIAYPLLLVLYVISPRKLPTAAVAALLVTLNFIGYFAGNWPENFQGPADILFYFEMVNRTFLAGVLIGMWGVAQGMQEFHRRLALLTGKGPNPELGEHLSLAIQQLLATIGCVLLLVTLAVADLMQPRQYNLPQLYILVAVLSSFAGSRKLLCITCGFMLLAAAAGFYLGPPQTVTNAPPITIDINRAVACLALVLVVAALSWYMPRRLHSQ